MPPLMVDYRLLQAQAHRDGRRCVVGALILNRHGQVFVHRRGQDRRLLPGGWDIVGGHVEAGEGLLAALGREIGEETGWRLTGTPQLAYVADWESVDGAAVVRRREFDFLVEVEGDLERPRLEYPKHVEARWIGPEDLGLLDENRGLDGGLVRRLVELALRSCRQGELHFPHVTLFLDASAAAAIEPLRVAWDPAMASQIAAHLTVAYPSEVGSLAELTSWAGAAAKQVGPFRLGLGRIRHFQAPEHGIFVAVDDLDQGWRRLRESILGAEPTGPEVVPHVTIVHPRTTNRGPAARQQLAGTSLGAEVTIDRLSVTAFDGRRWLSAASFPLTG